MNIIGTLRQGAMQIGNFASANSPSLLTGLGAAGVVVTVATAIDGTVKAVRAVDEKKEERVRDWVVETGKHPSEYPYDQVFNKKEVIKITWKYYVPTAIFAGVSIGCFVGANSINLRRNAALAALYSFTEKSLEEYRAKVAETIGERKEEKIQDAIAQDKVKKNPPTEGNIFFTSNGTALFLDDFSGRYFQSDIEKVRKAVNDLNAALLVEGYICLNEFYDLLGIPHIGIGGEMGWSASDQGLIDLDYSGALTEEEPMRPVIVIKYSVKPRRYSDFK